MKTNLQKVYNSTNLRIIIKDLLSILNTGPINLKTLCITLDLGFIDVPLLTKRNR